MNIYEIKDTDKPLVKIRKKRKLSLRDLYFKINKEIDLCRLSDINICKKDISKEEIEILNKYLKLTDEEIEELEDMQLDQILIESSKRINKLGKLVPKNLKAGEEFITKCPNCGSKLKISRNSCNGHLWIVCEKEGVLVCE